jgi:type IV pilus assembly protein PilE
MRRVRGFTLIELVVVVAIVAILATIAIPAFTEQVRKSRRAEAMSVLGDLHLRQERWRANNTTYGTLPQILGVADASAFNAAQSFYNFAVTASSATAFTLTANPKNAQQNDRCGSFTLAVDNVARPGEPPAKSAAGSNCF